MEHLWQFIRRYDQQDPELFTIRGQSSPISSGELKTTNLLTDANYQHCPQEYRRTAQLFNGYPVWQGTRDTQTYIVAANIPVSEMTGYIYEGTLIDHPYVAIYPDPLSSETKLVWKITKAADIPSIVDGLEDYDLVRGTIYPLEAAPRYILGVVEGGDSPVPGSYFRELQWLPGEQGVFFTQYLSLNPMTDCIDADAPDAKPIVVGTNADLLDLVLQATSSCEDMGLYLEQFVTEFVMEYGSSDIWGTAYLAQAVACCGNTPIETSSAQEESSSAGPTFNILTRAGEAILTRGGDNITWR